MVDVIDLMAEQLCQEVQRNTRLEDLGDSLDLLDALTVIEKESGVKFPDEAVGRMLTAGDVEDYVRVHAVVLQ